MAAPTQIIAELESAISSGSSERRVDTLRRITDLFLNEADRLNDQQIGVFDDVLVHLIQRIETKALIQLSTTLAPVENAPAEVIRQLAYNDEIAVAGPVLTTSNRLNECDLVEIGRTKSQSHLLAMSGRSALSEAVTDVLIERGNDQVTHRLARNSGARFSDTGFNRLVKRAETDESLAEKLGLRLDIPLNLLRQLLQKASDAVRSRLLAAATPANQDQIQRALASIVSEIGREASAPRDFKQSESLVYELNRRGQLKESTLVEFARGRMYEEMTSTLALFCQTSVDVIELLMRNSRHDGVVVACKAAKLSWSTASHVLQVRFAHHKMSEIEMSEAKNSFLALTQATAQRILRFMIVQHKTKAG